MIKFLTKNLFLITSLSFFFLAETYAQDSDKSKNEVANPDLVNKLQGGLANLLLSSNKLTTLMFNEKESEKIERALDSFKNDQTYLPEESDEKKSADSAPTETKEEINKKSYIYLASIMYFSDKYWAVWINGQKITSDDNDPNDELYLSSVQRDQVSVIWNISASKWKILLGKKAEGLESMINENNQVVVKFKLKPNQTYILGSNTIAEGFNVIGPAKKKLEVKKVEVKTDSTKKDASKSDVVKTPASPTAPAIVPVETLDSTASGIATTKAKTAESGAKTEASSIADTVSAAIAAATASNGAIVTTTGANGAVTRGGTQIQQQNEKD